MYCIYMCMYIASYVVILYMHAYSLLSTVYISEQLGEKKWSQIL